jgi:hypothetical protein
VPPAAMEKNDLSKEGGDIVEILNFIIAIVALIIAVMAFQRTGGIKDLRPELKTSEK